MAGYGGCRCSDVWPAVLRKWSEHSIEFSIFPVIAVKRTPAQTLVSISRRGIFRCGNIWLFQWHRSGKPIPTSLYIICGLDIGVIVNVKCLFYLRVLRLFPEPSPIDGCQSTGYIHDCIQCNVRWYPTYLTEIIICCTILWKFLYEPIKLWTESFVENKAAWWGGVFYGSLFRWYRHLSCYLSLLYYIKILIVYRFAQQNLVEKLDKIIFNICFRNEH